MGVWRHFHGGSNFWILTLFGSGYAGLGLWQEKPSAVAVRMSACEIWPLGGKGCSYNASTANRRIPEYHRNYVRC
jgi:hypothetical protein